MTQIAFKPVADEDRRIANINDPAAYTAAASSGPYATSDWQMIQLDPNSPEGLGLIVLKMAPGVVSPAHEHTCDEQFVVLEGELVENDGTVYRAGDFVWLRAGTQHESYTPNGCLLVVHTSTVERYLKP